MKIFHFQGYFSTRLLFPVLTVLFFADVDRKKDKKTTKKVGGIKT